MKAFICLALLALAVMGPAARAEDGYDLWLRYRPVQDDLLSAYRAAATEIVAPRTLSPTLAVAASELSRGFGGLLGTAPTAVPEPTRDGSVVFGTPAASPLIAQLHLDLKGLGDA